MSKELNELEQAKNDYLTKLKKVKLVEAGVDYNDLDIYSKYITADDEKEIEKQAAEIVADIKQEDSFSDVYIDERAWKPFS